MPAYLSMRAVALIIGSSAFAQSTPPGAAKPGANVPANNNAPINQSSKSGASVRQKIAADLQQAGFTNIKVIADSFVVQATDKSGNPVTMFISPDSMTFVSEVEPNEQSGSRSMFTSVPAQDELTSQVVGLDVYNSSNQKIGKIQNVAFEQNALKAYILGVGGFIGMGEHDVAVRPQAITVTYNPGEKKWHATSELTIDQLKAAPDAMRANAQPITGGMFADIQATDDLSSKITDLDVYNKANQNIGKIQDVAFNAKGVKAYILGVGGFLGLGERYVAVRPSAVELNYNASDRKWHAEMDTSADQLKSAPQYRYASNAY